MPRWIIAVALLALAACVSPDPAVDEAALAQDGREIAEAECARCHAVGEYGDSPLAAAPVFRTVLSRYRADVLEEELINGIRVSHPMPEFQFNPQSADALIAYLRTVQQPPAQ